jgi:hypothetical protein
MTMNVRLANAYLFQIEYQEKVLGSIAGFVRVYKWGSTTVPGWTHQCCKSLSRHPLWAVCTAVIVFSVSRNYRSFCVVS